MTKLEPLEKWKYHHFESSCYRTEDYATFEGVLKRWYKRLCDNNGWELVKYVPGHFACGCFIRGKNGKMINILGNDVRDRNSPGGYWGCGWWHICYRFTKNENDYHGEGNRWSLLDNLEEDLQKLLNDSGGE